jgi:hypothetical protein
MVRLQFLNFIKANHLDFLPTLLQHNPLIFCRGSILPPHRIEKPRLPIRSLRRPNKTPRSRNPSISLILKSRELGCCGPLPCLKIPCPVVRARVLPARCVIPFDAVPCSRRPVDEPNVFYRTEGAGERKPGAHCGRCIRHRADDDNAMQKRGREDRRNFCGPPAAGRPATAILNPPRGNRYSSG